MPQAFLGSQMLQVTHPPQNRSSAQTLKDMGCGWGASPAMMGKGTINLSTTWIGGLWVEFRSPQTRLRKKKEKGNIVTPQISLWSSLFFSYCKCRQHIHVLSSPYNWSQTGAIDIVSFLTVHADTFRRVFIVNLPWEWTCCPVYTLDLDTWAPCSISHGPSMFHHWIPTQLAFFGIWCTWLCKL